MSEMMFCNKPFFWAVLVTNPTALIRVALKGHCIEFGVV